MSNYLTEKWEPILSHQDLPEISDPYRKAVTAQLLENQEMYLREQSIMGGATGLLTEHDYVPTQQGGPPTNNTNPAGDGYAPGAQLPATSLGGDLAPGYSGYADGRGPVAGFDPVMISLIRRSMPNLIAYDICGVQPMSGPTGLIFAMRSMYDGPLGPNEALFDEPDPTFSAGYGLPRNGQMTDGAPYEGSNDPRADGYNNKQPYGSRHDGAPYDYVPGEYPYSHGKDGYTGLYDESIEINANPGLLETAIAPLGSLSYAGRREDPTDDESFFVDVEGNRLSSNVWGDLSQEEKMKAMQPGSGAQLNAAGQPVGTGAYDPVLADLRGMNTHEMEHLGQYGGVDAYDGTWSTDAGVDYRFRQMGFSIEKVVVEARGRALKAQYSMELAQDLRAIHGLDAEAELANILSSEILAEINREVIRTVYRTALPGAQNNVNTPGIFDLDLDSNGRWSVEKFKGLLFQIERDANAIAQLTRRGKGNIIICSADVASALTMAGVLDYTPALNANLNVDDTGNLFAGTINGKFKVYIDPFSANVSNTHYYLMGYKGSSPYDAGLFYCPYIPLQMVRSVSAETFQPNIGFKTRYGIVANPFAEGAINGPNRGNQGLGRLVDNSNRYYRRTRVDNLM